MSRIHYFQRYSQKENVVTNNTLLLLSRLYNHNTAQFEDFLNALSGDDNLSFEVGMQFAQQQGNKSKSSVPDGVMAQKSCKVIIETKLHNDYRKKQLLNHLDSFSNEDTQVLLMIDPRMPANSFMEPLIKDVTSFNVKEGKRITCLAVTFGDILEKFDSVLFDHDLELKDILEDYRSFCDSMNLLPRDELMMRAIVTGQSFAENMTHNVYYAPSDRGFRSHAYLGLYKNKSVRGVGKITNIIDAEYDKSSKIFNVLNYKKGRAITLDEQERVIAIMESAEKGRGWNIYTDHSFFIVDKFEKTNFEKSTKYPIQQSKYFDLGLILNSEKLPNDEDIAKSLQGKTWS